MNLPLGVIDVTEVSSHSNRLTLIQLQGCDWVIGKKATIWVGGDIK